MKLPPSKRITIEKNKPFSESAIWNMQREYFDKEGINAWVNQVPFYITSNPFIAQAYTKLVLGFISDWLAKNPQAKKDPFYILELGTGSGRFSYFFVKTLLEYLERMNMQDVKFCYIMSDFTKHNMQYWETHPELKPLVDKGLIDFAIYNMELEEPIILEKSKKTLNQELLTNPLTVFANYIFDTITHDSFTVRNRKIHELLLSLSTDQNNMNGNQPINMEAITVDYSINEIHGGYYGDPHLDSILDEYKKTLQETSFLFPIGSFKAIKYLRALSNNNLLILSTDKGYNTVESLDHLSHPTISFHGSFSMMVNFHAIKEYFKNIGGDAVLQQSRKGIKTSVFASGFKLSDSPQLAVAIEEHVDGFSPGDYFVLHTRMSEAFQECSVATLAAHMQLALWDPHMYLKLSNYIVSKIDQEDYETIQFLAHNMDKMAKNYYYMPSTQCVLFDIGIFFHAIKEYQKAAQYYLQAKPYIGEQFSLYYNLALCQHHIGDNIDALEHFKKALELDPSSNETEQWINYLQKEKD